MPTLWAVLEERTRGWSALARQALADTVWQDQVLGRFDRSGDPRALPYLYPYLRHHDRQVRLRTLAVAARVFAGAGGAALPHLAWFTENPDLFIRDRAVQVVASAMHGAAEAELLATLSPYGASANRFVRRQALTGMAAAAAATCSNAVVGTLERISSSLGEELPTTALAEVHAGHPTEAVWRRLVGEPNHDRAVDAAALLVRGAPEPWFDRALAEAFVPRFSNRLIGDERGHVIFRQRNAVLACGRGGRGRGMRGLVPMLGIGESCAAHAVLVAVHDLFDDADEAEQRPRLERSLASGALPEQRLATIALGRLLMASGDEAAIALLRERCASGSGALRAAAVQSLGCVARSSARRDLLELARPLLADGETAVAALRAIGLIALGTGDRDADRLVRDEMARWSALPRGRRHHRPLAACHWALGLVHLGTGDAAVLDALLPTFALPDVPAYRAYRSAASKAVSLVEHGEPWLTIAVAEPHTPSPERWGGGVYGPWTGLLTSLDP
jgi:hypothetical protein